jgi:UDP-GlcNAc:undecaprenyl-phosphate GlcNAc-1-phosphate transferase
MRTAVFAFFISLVLSALLTPLVRRLALRRGWLDHALDARKIHGRPIPRLGGVAIVLSFYAPMLGMLAYPTALSLQFYAEPVRAVALLGGAACIALLGLYDDMRGATAWGKLTVQFAVALGLWFAGLRVEHVTLPGLGAFDLGLWSLPVTLLWVAGVINAMNLIDGLDGLAGGVALLALSTSFVVAFFRGGATMALLSAALGGGVLGFLVYNFNPASIFMGDTGSMFLGFVLAAGAMVSTSKASTAVAILVPLLSLGVPLTDTLLAVARRARAGRPIFSADRDHIHHRLLAAGLSQRQAVLVLYGASLLLGGGALLLSFANSWQVAIVLTVTAAATGFGVRQLYRFTAPRPVEPVSNATPRQAALGCARSLRKAATPEEAFGALSPLARSLGGARLVLLLPGRGALESRPEQVDLEAATPTLVCPLGTSGELGSLEVTLPPRREPLSRDEEIAVEAVGLLLGAALVGD